MVSPAESAALRLKPCGMPLSKTFALKSGLAALLSRRTATSVVVKSRPTKLPTMLYVPDDGAVQRMTLFSPDGPGCRSSAPGGIGLLPAGLMTDTVGLWTSSGSAPLELQTSRAPFLKRIEYGVSAAPRAVS